MTESMERVESIARAATERKEKRNRLQHKEACIRRDKRLETNRFLFGDYITDSDVRAYVTLVRWDVNYYHNIGPVKKPIKDYKNIWGYLRELNTIPAFHNNSNARTLALNGIRKDGNFFKSYNERILTKVDFDKLWADDGARRKLSRTPDEMFFMPLSMAFFPNLS